MKNKLFLFGLAGVTVATMSFTLIQKNDEFQEPKKKRHIKMTKIENGKKVELDTVLNNDDVFVWHGDTVGGKEMVKHISPSGFDKRKHIKVIVDGDKNDEKVMIFHSKDGKEGEPMSWNPDSDEAFDVFSEDLGDSIRKKIVIHKRMADRDMDHMMFMNGPGHMPFPPVPHLKMIHQKDGRMIDLNDKNIISYRKKDLSGNREKIEIIRNKSAEPEHSDSFSFENNDLLMPPPPPMPPHAPGGNQEMKHSDKNVEVEVETEENK